MADEGGQGVERLASDLRDVENREYERAVAATARLDGPAGPLVVRRTYEALPFHNDVVHPEGADSNDAFLDRPDAVHVYTRYYRPDEEGDDYFLDRHETWRLDDPAILGEPAQFRTACERHHLADLAAEYWWATDESVRSERARPDREAPDGWQLLS
jgi:hypothetical protein